MTGEEPTTARPSAPSHHVHASGWWRPVGLVGLIVAILLLSKFFGLGERLGAFLAQMNDSRPHTLGVRYYGGLAEGRNDVIVNAVLVGLFKPILSSGVTLVNARSVAADRGIEIVESRSSRPRNYTNLLSIKLHTSDGERWVE
ncbi:MAG: hypothetical protein IH788_05925, partial [Nitrospinae bacterium]|nr:hypothetical protein [Nitrospinota bacterium]